MSVRALRERREQQERERAVMRMRDAVVRAIGPAYLHRLGSSAIYEAVDEALAQIVAAGNHLREPEHVKALWITCARRRVIDEYRSAESKNREALPTDDTADDMLAGTLGGDLVRPTEDGRQWWRVREILSVLRGDQRRWAEAWYDEVLSVARLSGAQPRGLPEALGWTPSKTKSVSRRARMKMAAFIDNRVSGVVCDEQRAVLDAFILASRGEPGVGLDDAGYQAVLFHLAGCEDCWEAWHARRRTLLGRCGAVLTVPIDALAVAAQEIGAKLVGVAVGAHGQAYALMTRVSVGGAAAAGGGAATITGKTTAVCVGVVCAATAGGEIAGVLPPIASEPARQTRSAAPKQKRVDKPVRAVREAERQRAPAAPAARPAVAPPPPPPAVKAAVRKVLAPRRAPARSPAPTFAVRDAGVLPPADTTTGTSRPAKPATPARPTPMFRQSNCAPGDFGC